MNNHHEDRTIDWMLRLQHFCISYAWSFDDCWGPWSTYVLDSMLVGFWLLSSTFSIAAREGCQGCSCLISSRVFWRIWHWTILIKTCMRELYISQLNSKTGPTQTVRQQWGEPLRVSKPLGELRWYCKACIVKEQTAASLTVYYCVSDVPAMRWVKIPEFRYMVLPMSRTVRVDKHTSVHCIEGRAYKSPDS